MKLPDIYVFCTENGKKLPAQFVQDVKLHMFPRLKEFTHSYVGNISALHIYPVWFKLFSPGQASSVAHNLEILKINLYLYGRGGSANLTDDTWTARLMSAAADPIWGALDTILAKRRYLPALRKASIHFRFITFKQIRSGTTGNEFPPDSTIDPDDLQKEVRGALLKMFSTSFKALTPLEIIVDLDM